MSHIQCNCLFHLINFLWNGKTSHCRCSKFDFFLEKIGRQNRFEFHQNLFYILGSIGIDLWIFTNLTNIHDFCFTVSLENVITDVSDLEKNMEVVKRECEIRSKDRACSQNLNILRDFLSNNEDKLKRLRADTKVAQDAFNECTEYFGESPRMTDANTFFSLLVRFTRSFKVSIDFDLWLWFCKVVCLKAGSFVWCGLKK